MGATHLDEEEIFTAALEKELPAERSAYLDQACGEDAELRCGVEHLLKLSEASNGFLETPPIAGVTPMEADDSTEGPGPDGPPQHRDGPRRRNSRSGLPDRT